MVTFACLAITMALMCKPTLFFGVNRTSCPDTSQWRLRAYSFCNRSEPAYFCLRDANKNVYKEFCRKTSDVQRPGYEFVIRGELDGRKCSNDRYQPIKLTTNGQSKCMYKKSKCTGEGQIQYNNRTTISDRLCRCDSTHSYGFVKTTGDRCFCDPSIEDCTCYKITCQVGYVLSSDYKCTEWEQFSGNNYCPDIKRSDIISGKPDRGDRHIMTNPEAYLSVFKNNKFTAQIILYLMIAGTLVCVAVVLLTGIAKLFPKGTKTRSCNEQDGFKLPKDIAKLRSYQIKNWKKEEKQIYVTTAMHTVTELLTKCTCLTVIGPAASGKSALIHYVSRQWLGKRYQIIPIISKEYTNRPLELLKSLNSDFPKIFVIDDFCGVDHIDVIAVDCWKNISEELINLKLNDNTGKNQVKIILACRESIFESNQFKGLDFITGQIYKIDDYYFSQEEKCSILEKFTKKDNVEKDCPLLQGCVKYFPLLCKIAANKGVDKLEDFLKVQANVLNKIFPIRQMKSLYQYLYVCYLGNLRRTGFKRKEDLNK